MVVFICDVCQESLSRGKVKTHLERCRNCSSLSCVDCGARFDPNTYEKHISCYSEAEKYTGKRETKQDDWTETVTEALNSLTDAQARQGLEALINKVGIATLPRKKPKFVNMCKSSHSYIRPQSVEIIWAALEAIIKAKSEQKAKEREEFMAKRRAQKEAQESVEEAEEKKRKKLKKLLKKIAGNQATLKSLVEHFGDKKDIKKLAKRYPDHFELEKGENGRLVKLVKRSEAEAS